MDFPFFYSKKKKRIFILLGHPNKDSLNGFLADKYEEGAKHAGHEVRRMNIGELSFDPILWNGYKDIQTLEPDLMAVQENIRWSEHFVVFYPAWFSTMPALLKGLFDRCWLPGFAYHFYPSGLWWKGLLKGRSARVFVTTDTPGIVSNIIFGDTTNEIKKGILWFAGFSPIKVFKVAPLKFLKPEKAKWWGERLRSFGFLGA